MFYFETSLVRKQIKYSRILTSQVRRICVNDGEYNPCQIKQEEETYRKKNDEKCMLLSFIVANSLYSIIYI